MELDDYLKEVTKNKVISIDPDKVDYFNSLIDELYDIAGQHNDYSFMHNQFSDLASDVRYASGSKSLHRGFYCPSPILDLVVGGYKRGRLVNKPTKTSQEYYQYYFDSHQQLIYINQFNKSSTSIPYSTEFIIRKDNIEYGLTYHNASKNLELLARCVYENNKIKNYATVSYHGISKDMISIQFEEYEYENDVLSKVNFYSGIIPRYNLYEKAEYELLYDNNGKIIEYIARSEYQGQLMERRYKV